MVEIHNADAVASPLWYRIGQIVGPAIKWSDGGLYDYGFNPCVAFCGATVIGAHNASGDGGRLRFRLGRIFGSVINWSQATGSLPPSLCGNSDYHGPH